MSYNITTSKFYNKEHNNFDARTPEARQELWENGLAVNSSLFILEHVQPLAEGVRNLEKIVGEMNSISTQALIGFDEQTHNYSKYEEDWKAKEAQSSWTPALEHIYIFDRDLFDTLTQKAKAKALEAKQKHANYMAEQLQSQIATQEGLLARSLAEIRIKEINGKKYKYEVDGRKFATLEEAQRAHDLAASSRDSKYGAKIAELKAELAEI